MKSVKDKLGYTWQIKIESVDAVDSPKIAGEEQDNSGMSVVKEEAMHWDDMEAGCAVAPVRNNTENLGEKQMKDDICITKHEPCWYEEAMEDTGNVAVEEKLVTDDTGVQVDAPVTAEVLRCHDNLKQNLFEPEFVSVGILKVEPQDYEPAAVLSMDPFAATSKLRNPSLKTDTAVEFHNNENQFFLQDDQCCLMTGNNSTPVYLHKLKEEHGEEVERSSTWNLSQCPGVVTQDLSDKKPLLPTHCSEIVEHNDLQGDAGVGDIDDLENHTEITGSVELRVSDQCDKSYTQGQGVPSLALRDGGEKSYESGVQCVAAHRTSHCSAKPFVCGVSNASFLEGHKKTHPEKRLYSCVVCHAAFSRKDNLTCHIKLHSGEKPHVCDECGARFALRSGLRKHRKTHSGEKPFACDECEARFASKSTLTSHKRIHSGEKPYVCADCGARFSDRSTLRKHRIRQSRKNVYACNICEARFTFRCTLAKHKRKHAGDKPYLCGECGTGFDSSDLLNMHKISHPEKKSFACDECDARFISRSRLSAHKRTHFGDKPLFVCDICNAKFTKKSYLTVHNRRHSGERRHACSDCDGRFLTKTALNMHRQRHSDEKPYACGECGARFTFKGGLKVHMEGHSDVDHECEVCKARFKRKIYLTFHSRIHSGVWPYKCDVCGASYARSTGLSNHKLTHSEEKPFAYDSCGAQFCRRTSHVTHKMMQSGKQKASNTPYICNICSADFNHKRRFYEHLGTHSKQ